MASNRENIQAALLARLTAKVTGLASGSTFRRYVDFTKFSQLQQPALAVTMVGAHAQRQPGMPARWIQHAMVVLYVRTSNENTVTPETQLLALIEQVETALQRQPDETSPNDDYGTTLGGLVWMCHLTDMQIHHGHGEGQAAASLTVEMLSLS